MSETQANQSNENTATNPSTEASKIMYQVIMTMFHRKDLPK